MTSLYGSIHCDVADTVVMFHCDHDDGSTSYKVAVDGDHVVIYLSGTPEELGAFADAIVRTVSRHTIDVHEQAARDAAEAQNARGLAFVGDALRVHGKIEP